ncbi:hypothetical protein OG948_34685 (plasmid) [Embleya sp. NBC_00888]|uniref:hypothetical protein n=1 Tax=Embleya sp. NBC_00888 TaxID=2975960 RepID=UPI002F90A389|nr:hypothetical protein OG948_34685 [Embleya sp. NBC_00888]
MYDNATIQAPNGTGTRVEQWDACEGRALSQPIDLGALRLTTKDQPSYATGRHREPGYTAVTVQGESDMHAVDPRTGGENEALRVHLGGNLVVAVFLEDSRHMAVMTAGGKMEMWSASPRAWSSSRSISRLKVSRP